MLRIVSLIAVWAGLCSLAASPARTAGPAAAEDSDSPYEQVEMLDHSRYAGLIESEDDDWLTLIRIQSPRGQQMHLVIQPFDRRQVLAVSRLDAGKRAALEQQIEEFRNRATIEAAGMEAIRLEPREAEGVQLSALSQQVVHPGQHGRRAEHPPRDRPRRSRSSPPIARSCRRAASPPQPPRLVVLGSMDQYQSLLAKLGLKTKIENPACFLEDRNVVVVGSDLARLAAVIRQITAAERPACAGTSAIWKAGLPNVSARSPTACARAAFPTARSAHELTRERAKFKKQLEEKRDELRKSDQQIDRLFKQSAGQTLVQALS